MSDTAREQTAETVAEIVRRYVGGPASEGLTLSVVEQGIHREGRWWYVPVRNSSPVRTYKYYDVLTEIEDNIAQREGLELLLVPSG